MYDIDTIKQYIADTEAMTEESERWEWSAPPIPVVELTPKERRVFLSGGSLVDLYRRKKRASAHDRY